MQTKESPLLSELDVLVLDCQATAADPGKGHLLEMGWGRTSASSFEPADLITSDLSNLNTSDLSVLNTSPCSDKKGTNAFIQSYPVILPEGGSIPRRISMITGLKTEDLENGVSPAALWQKLEVSVNAVRGAHGNRLCPVVIHFSRYEEAYLRFLFNRFAAPSTVTGEESRCSDVIDRDREKNTAYDFPLEIICTHQVVRRLLPQLPNKGLRAAAGYLGFSLPESRRSSHHAVATAFIWRQSVQLLAEQGIRTLQQLQTWLKVPLKKSGKAAGGVPVGFYLMEPGLRLGLPHRPGVYRMLRSNGDILYVGKATSLKRRVNSYFHKKKRKGQAGNTLEMITQAAGLHVSITGSALEAALLETDEIKKHCPQYNTALRSREREIVFFSRDLTQVSSSPRKGEETFPIGPMPSANVLGALEIITGVTARGVRGNVSGILQGATAAEALGLLPEFAPDTQCFEAGFALFCERRDGLIKKLNYRSVFRTNPLQGVMELGRVFHLEYLEAVAAAKAEAEAKAEVETVPIAGDEELMEEKVEREEWQWTPEAVAKNIEWLFRHGAFLVRRARWFCILGESTLAWTTGETAGGKRRFLVFRGGEAVHRGHLEEKKTPPVPPGFGRPMQVRKQYFDVTTYDRMRVLTTELRRLVSAPEDRGLQLRLRPGVIPGKKELLKAFQWI
ncbi:MAG: GIY-YIG nuclease family protein [bacterium]|nr:GIY-YIG nuclease family protein [bacterium]